jgi:hypothetical protein
MIAHQPGSPKSPVDHAEQTSPIDFASKCTSYIGASIAGLHLTFNKAIRVAITMYGTYARLEEVLHAFPQIGL